MANPKLAPSVAESFQLLPIKREGSEGGSEGDSEVRSEDHSEVLVDPDVYLDLDSDFGDENDPLQGNVDPERARTGTRSQTRDRPRAGPRPRSRSPSQSTLQRRRLRKNCLSIIGVILGLCVVLAVVFGAVISVFIYWFKPRAGGGGGSSSIDKDTFIDLDYATYVGKTLSVYPPSDDGGDRHNMSAAPVGINRYLGMRYAAPPTGEQRWRPPLPPYDESSLQSAKTFRPICIGQGVQPMPDNDQDEDCLYVNVWGPANVVENVTSLPVWVFVQGGGYGGNSNADINGADVVARSNGSIVFVNFNYRVGVHGFLNIPSDNTTASISPEESANFGLLDQRALLEWIQKHIHRFGGDPRHVVVHGGSAGAGSVALHAVSHGGRDDGLFAGMVAESLFVPTLPQCTDIAYKFWRAVDAVCYKGSEEAWTVELALECLRRQTLSVLQDLVNVGHPLQYNGEDRPDQPKFYWGPCVDGTFLTDRPSVAFKNGQFVRVPMLYGVATDEGTLFAPNAAAENEVVDFVVNNFPGLAADDKGTSVVHEHYPQLPWLPMHNSWFPTAARLYGESTFVCPTMSTLDAVAAVNKNSNNLYAYRYAMHDPDNFVFGIGTVHMMDNAAIFGPKNVACCPPSSYTPDGDNNDDNDDKKKGKDRDSSGDRDGIPGLVPVMMDYYLSFVRTFSPNTYKSPWAAEWGTWDNKSRLVITSGSDQVMETVPDDLAERCRVWLDLADVTKQ
ncbi:hypothetical protein SBRCBS47491_004715 [Sporothrix bragantina]|uniref:Carboxylesterase type B domain-containing protein n=1 Tax=Sporothrix bragantina TaxID=671064 RepID=A0ABP0BQX0_9PEZI